MKLKKLSLANYRGFEQIDIEFEDDITVIAGVNGVGKSSILNAITQSVSYFNSQYTPSKEKLLFVESTDVTNQKLDMSIASSFHYGGLELYVDINKNLPRTIEDRTKLEEERDQLRFAFREVVRGSKDERKLEDDLERLNGLLSPPEDTMHSLIMLPSDPIQDPKALKVMARNAPNQPISVSYSTKRLLSRLPPRVLPVKSVEISAAYSKALSEGEVSLHDFSNWYRFIQYDASENNPEEKPLIFQQLEKVLDTFLPGVSDLSFHEAVPPKFSLLKNGKRLQLGQLSDGEVGLLALIFDLTRRLATANPASNNPILEGAAIVLIDEVELHLHPRWQRKVLRRLGKVFKNCQFIVTTHSPQVIGQVKPEKLRLLHVNDDRKIVHEPVAQSFGMDSGWILQNIMGGYARDYDVEQKLSGIYDAIDDEQLEQARVVAEELRSEIGDFPELQECMALLDRLEMLEEYEED